MHQEVAAHVADWLWLLPVAVGSWGVKELRDLARSVSELNRNVAVIVERVTGLDETVERNTEKLSDVDRRVVALEARARTAV